VTSARHYVDFARSAKSTSVERSRDLVMSG